MKKRNTMKGFSVGSVVNTVNQPTMGIGEFESNQIEQLKNNNGQITYQQIKDNLPVHNNVIDSWKPTSKPTYQQIKDNLPVIRNNVIDTWKSTSKPTYQQIKENFPVRNNVIDSWKSTSKPTYQQIKDNLPVMRNNVIDNWKPKYIKGVGEYYGGYGYVNGEPTMWAFSNTLSGKRTKRPVKRTNTIANIENSFRKMI